MIKKIFKKVFKKFKKILSPIGKELKKGLKGVGKFFGKLGPIGTLALSLMLPGIGSALTSFGAWAGVGAGATAPFAGTIFGPLGKVIQGVAKVGNGVGKVFSSASEFVGNTVNTITGGKAGEFSNWVSGKLDKTRQMFGLETSMNQTGFETALNDNAKTLQGVNDVNAIAPTPTEPIVKPSEMFGAETSTTPSRLSDDELFAKAEQESLLSQKATPKVEPKTFKEMYPDRETIEVPVGYSEKTPMELERFNTTDAYKNNQFKTYELETKTVFKDSLSPEQLDAINIDDVKYYSDFNNNRVGKAQSFIKDNYMDKDGNFTDDFSKLVENPKDLQGQMLRQDVGAMAKPAAVVGSILAPEQAPETSGGSVSVTPLPTDTDVKDYTDSVSNTYAALGYRGPKSLDGYTMFGGYGNTPMNFLNNYSQRVIQPSMTISMPQLGSV